LTASQYATQADVDALRARLDALEGLPPRPAAVVIDSGDLLDMDEAMALSGRKACTIRKWAAKYRRTPRSIGKRLGSRWMLSRKGFLALIEDNLE
jgi:hypothetical protein